MEPQIEQLYLKKLIQKLKMKQMIKKWKKRVKKTKHRFLVLQEFCNSEKIYIDSLIRLKNEFQIPLSQKKVLSQADFEFVFNSLDSIIGLAEEMHRRMLKEKQNWHPHETQISSPLNYLEKFFKIYKDYCKNYIKSTEIINNIEEHPDVIPLLKPFKPSSILDFLVKPTQRPFKYPLLIRQYLHDLLPDHKDYKKLQKTQDVYKHLCDELNESMESQLRMKKMIELQKVFGDDIFESSRQLKSQFSAYHYDIPLKIYVFTDMLMIAKILYYGSLQKYMKIELNGASYVLKRERTKNFINRLFICGVNDSIHLVFKDLGNRDDTYTLMEGLINKLYQKAFTRNEMISQIQNKRQTMISRFTVKPKYQWKYQPTYKINLQITVVGAEQRIEKAQQKVTYFVKIKLGKPEEVQQILTLDIDTLKKVQAYLRQLYPQKNLPTLDVKSKSLFFDDFRNDFTKFIEFRSQHIESFLNYIFRMKEVCQRPELIFHKLRINEFIWKYIRKYKDKEFFFCQCESCLRTEIITNMEAYEKELNEHQKGGMKFCILKALHIHNSISLMEKSVMKGETMDHQLLWSFSKMNRINYSIFYRQKYGKALSFYVHIPSFAEQIKMKINTATSNDTVRDIINEICSRKGFLTSRDLVLVLSSGKEEVILDDDEYLWDYADYIKIGRQESSRSSIFQNFRSTFDLSSHEKQEWKLSLRKFYIFSKKQQEEGCQNNRQRYQLVLGQMLQRFKNGFIALPVNDIKVFCALFYGIEEYNSFMYSNNVVFNEEKLKNYLPKSKWNFISRDFITHVKEIIEKQIRLWDNIQLIYRAIIRQFGDKIGWLTQFFEVENTQPNSLIGGNRFVLVGVSKKKVIVLPRNSTAILLDFTPSELVFRVSGESLFVDTENRLYHFKGKNLFFFEKLVSTYQILSTI